MNSDDELMERKYFIERMIKDSGDYSDGDMFSGIDGTRINPYDICPACNDFFKDCPHMIMVTSMNPFWYKEKFWMMKQ